MPQFDYQAQSRGGERVSGTVSAADAHDAARALRDQGLFPVRLAPVGVSPWGASAIHHLRPVSPANLAQFFTQLASLLRGGLNAHDALDELSALVGDRRLGRVAGEISARAAEGVGLAEEFARYPAIFPRHVTGFVAAGEELGELPAMLQELAEQYQTEARLEGRLRWLRLYYGAVLVLALLVVPFPWMVSRGLSWYAGILLTRLLPILAGAVALIFAARLLNANPTAAEVRSRALFALPLLGGLARWSAVARFLRTLNLSQRAGVTFHRALELAGDATGSEAMRRSAVGAAADVRAGSGLDEAVAKVRFLPRRIQQMMMGAERTGELERRLDAAAAYAIEQREASVNAISSGAAVTALLGSAVVVLIALAAAWRNFYAALLERAGL